MILEKTIGLLFMIVSFVYGYASYTYPLLPFEINMSFLPNTMPMLLSVLGMVLALIVVLRPEREHNDDRPEVKGGLDLIRWREYKILQAIFLIITMVLYALSLQPLGFLAATVGFLVGAGWILGERRPFLMVFVASCFSAAIWFLVHETLGIYLRPLPWFAY